MSWQQVTILSKWATCQLDKQKLTITKLSVCLSFVKKKLWKSKFVKPKILLTENLCRVWVSLSELVDVGRLQMSKKYFPSSTMASCISSDGKIHMQKQRSHGLLCPRCDVSMRKLFEIKSKWCDEKGISF